MFNNRNSILLIVLFSVLVASLTSSGVVIHKQLFSRVTNTKVDSCDCSDCFWGVEATNTPTELDTIPFCYTGEGPPIPRPDFVELIDPDCEGWSTHSGCYNWPIMPIWWDVFGVGCKSGKPLNCDEREYCDTDDDSIGIWLHFVDSLSFSPEMYDNPCISAKFCVQVDDSAYIKINGNIIGSCGVDIDCDEYGVVANPVCPYFCFDGGVDTLPSGEPLPNDLYLECDDNYIEVCARSVFGPYGSIIYRLEAFLSSEDDEEKPGISSFYPPDSSFIRCAQGEPEISRCNRAFYIEYDSDDGIDVTLSYILSSWNSDGVPTHSACLGDTIYCNASNYRMGLMDIEGGLRIDATAEKIYFNPRMWSCWLGWGMQMDSVCLVDLCGADTMIIFDEDNAGKWRFFIDRMPPRPLNLSGSPWLWPLNGDVFGHFYWHYPRNKTINARLYNRIWDQPGYNPMSPAVPRANVDPTSLGFVVDGTPTSPSSYLALNGYGIYNPLFYLMWYDWSHTFDLNGEHIFYELKWKPKGGTGGICDKVESSPCDGPNYMDATGDISLNIFLIYFDPSPPWGPVLLSYVADDTSSTLCEVLTDGYIEDGFPYTACNEIAVIDTIGDELKYKITPNNADSYLDEIFLIRIASIGSLKVVRTTDGDYHSIGALLMRDTECTICDTCPGSDTLDHFSVDTTGTLTVVFENPPDNLDLQFGLLPLQTVTIQDDTLNDIKSEADRALTVRIANGEAFDTIAIIPSQMLRTTQWVNIIDDYITGDSLLINLVWDGDKPYRHYCFFLDTVEASSFTVDTIALSTAVFNGQDTVTTLLNSTDSDFVQLCLEEEVGLEFTYTKPGNDSTETVYLVTNGFYARSHAPAWECIP